jgi:DNA repair ATPase RecN
LRENSLELENAKSLLSEKEVIIKNLEEELARCQSELDAREKKLNDVEVRNFETQNINHFFSNMQENCVS